jgi:hypothetical protein
METNSSENMKNDTGVVLSLSQIREDVSYINRLNLIILKQIKSTGYSTISSVIEEVHSICPELKEFCNENKEKFRVTTVKDKGLVGKIIEFYLFGNLPNNDSRPDTPYGDIKATHFKPYKTNKRAFHAKERLTLTNFGNPSDEKNIKCISDKQSICETKYYEKMKNGIILVLQYDKSVIYDTIGSIYGKKIIAILRYDLDELFVTHMDIQSIFQKDFDMIKTCILEKNVTQCGQTYLHIHKHGSKGALTRAFGFTNKFLTKLVSIHLHIPITVKGRSEYIEL